MWLSAAVSLASHQSVSLSPGASIRFDLNSVAFSHAGHSSRVAKLKSWHLWINAIHGLVKFCSFHISYRQHFHCMCPIMFRLLKQYMSWLLFLEEEGTKRDSWKASDVCLRLWKTMIWVDRYFYWLRPLVAIVIITTLKEEVSGNSMKIQKVHIMWMLGMDVRVKQAPLFVSSVKPKVNGESFWSEVMS